LCGIGRCAPGGPPEAEAGVPRAITEVLGHAEIGVTMNTYIHVLPELRQEAADAIDELFGT
jgi:integrase